jgi:aryl-alcohol dehydrogenase-like predicted oxidoreductase
MSKFPSQVKLLWKNDPSVQAEASWQRSAKAPGIAIAALRAGLDLGMTQIDTAGMYLSGNSEEWITGL